MFLVYLFIIKLLARKDIFKYIYIYILYTCYIHTIYILYNYAVHNSPARQKSTFATTTCYILTCSLDLSHS